MSYYYISSPIVLVLKGVLVAAVLSGSAQALSLKETVLHVLETNPEIRAAFHEHEARKHELKQARSAYLPTLSIDAGVGQEMRRSPSTGNTSIDLTREELGLHASQTVFDGFATRAEVKRQQSRLKSASHNLEAVSGKLALRTISVYLDVMRYAELLDLVRVTLWEHQNIYDQMKLRYETGVGSKADFDQISARLALANANMIVAQNNYDDTQVAFHRLTGMYPLLDSFSRPSVFNPLPESKSTALKHALENHPTLQAASADVSAAQQQYKASTSVSMPKISLEADRRWDKNIGGIEGNDDDFIIALRLRYELFSGGANKARRLQTASLLNLSKDIRNNSRRQIVENLNLAWNAYEAQSMQLIYLKQHVDSAVDTREAYKKQFGIGRRTLLDLLNTENEVIESKKTLINAEFDQVYTHYRVLNAMGVLIRSL